MHGGIVVVEISGIGLIIHLFLHKVHALEVLEIVGILHCHAIF